MTICVTRIKENLMKSGMSEHEADIGKWEVISKVRSAVTDPGQFGHTKMPWKVCFAVAMKKYNSSAMAFKICGKKTIPGKPQKGRGFQPKRNETVQGNAFPLDTCKSKLKIRCPSLSEERLEKVLASIKRGTRKGMKVAGKKKEEQEKVINVAIKALEDTSVELGVSEEVLAVHLEECPMCHWIDFYELGKFSPKMERCIHHLKAQGKPKSSAIPTCIDTMKKAGKPIH